MKPDLCPRCKVDLTDKVIPQDVRSRYKGATHVGPKIAIFVGQQFHAWKCPRCGHEWRDNAQVQIA